MSSEFEPLFAEPHVSAPVAQHTSPASTGIYGISTPVICGIAVLCIVLVITIVWLVSRLKSDPKRVVTKQVYVPVQKPPDETPEPESDTDYNVVSEGEEEQHVKISDKVEVVPVKQPEPEPKPEPEPEPEPESDIADTAFSIKIPLYVKKESRENAEDYEDLLRADTIEISKLSAIAETCQRPAFMQWTTAKVASGKIAAWREKQANKIK
jgi:hypothetical protein